MKAHEAHFQILAQEALPLGDSPFDAGFCDVDLGVDSVGDWVEEVEKLTNYAIVSNFIATA